MMAMPQSPAVAARSRYANAFQSKIFEPMPEPAGPAFVPAGKRRDQTTQEMFGSYNDKELHACPKTFVPKDYLESAREKKLNFLSSDVLPRTYYRNQDGPLSPNSARKFDPDYEDEDTERMDPHVRRQMELSSELFGRETPAVTTEELYDMKKRLTPSDFKWFNIPEGVKGDSAQALMTHQDRSYNEKCSNLFEHRSPQVAGPSMKMKADQVEEEMGEAKRRANVYYSDLFGRNTPMGEPQAFDERRPKPMGSSEEQIVVHQDWTDSRTEIVCGARGSTGDERASTRKSDELHQTRIFQRKDYYVPPDSVDAVTTDNSAKVRSVFGRPTQDIHQAHLRTSLTNPEFYDEAMNTKHWEVVELHISGLPETADENTVRQLCRDFDLQIVKVQVEMDPVRNLCKGRSKIMVRYNPTRDSIAGLVGRLQEVNLRVEL